MSHQDKCMYCGYLKNEILYDENNIAYTKKLYIFYDRDGKKIMNPKTHLCDSCVTLYGNKVKPINDGYTST